MKVDQIITSVRAKFIHNLRKGRLPTEFEYFASMVSINDENNRSSWFSIFNFKQVNDKATPKYHVIKTWNNLPFEVKSAQPDDFLDSLYFNSWNEQPDGPLGGPACWPSGGDTCIVTLPWIALLALSASIELVSSHKIHLFAELYLH